MSSIEGPNVDKQEDTKAPKKPAKKSLIKFLTRQLRAPQESDEALDSKSKDVQPLLNFDKKPEPRTNEEGGIEPLEPELEETSAEQPVDIETGEASTNEDLSDEPSSTYEVVETASQDVLDEEDPEVEVESEEPDINRQAPASTKEPIEDDQEAPTVETAPKTPSTQTEAEYSSEEVYEIPPARGTLSELMNRLNQTERPSDTDSEHQTTPTPASSKDMVVSYFAAQQELRSKMKKQEAKTRRLNRKIKKTNRRVNALDSNAKTEKIKQQDIKKTLDKKLNNNTIITMPKESIRKERQKAPEARQLHTDNSMERIGHVIVAAEAVKSPKPPKAEALREETPNKTSESLKADDLTQKRVETMNQAELLRYSSNIMVDGSNLRQIYETHLIGEKGLRRLVMEHVKGGDLKRVLRHEIVEREIDFERDPVLRGMSPTSSSGGGAANTKSTNDEALNLLMKKAEVSIPSDGGEELAFYKARANYESSHSHDQRQFRAIDIFFSSVIAILAASVLLMYLFKR
jgi:hypothetical protein